MESVLDILHARGFIKDISDEEDLRRMVQAPISLYCGFDATAPSLHVGHLVSIMALAWYGRFGHRPIALMGGGTTLIGDPTFRQTTRPMLSLQEIDQNLQSIRQQFDRFLDFEDGRALMVNNADWLTGLNYVEFMRDIGSRFTVNQLLSLEAYRTRLEAGGLTFLEFSYALMQSYDFLRLYEDHDCILQIGGSDQWGNSVSGADLIRRKTGGKAFVHVSPLIETGEGAKMGKSEGNAIWLSASMTSPYAYYQYWRNVADSAVERCLAIFTFLPLDRVQEVARTEGSQLNQAKEILAFEATSLLHGEEEARKAQEAAHALFSGAESSENIPTIAIDAHRLSDGLPITELFKVATLVASANEARSLIKQGGLSMNGNPVTDAREVVYLANLDGGELILSRGRKRHMRIVAR
ncbi:MAG: tyrosine--tRNA ligase [Chloroflexota bacterium]